MTKLRCVNCGNFFTPVPQVPKQAYCSKSDCQKERRRQWQSMKLKTDPAYRENQTRAQQAWTQKNPGYWREHRAGKERTSEPPVAKDKLKSAEENPSTLSNGMYRLKVLAQPDEIKMDVWIVELTSIDAGKKTAIRLIKR